MPSLQGLSEAEATRRLEVQGPNRIPGAPPRGALGVLRDVLSEPMLLLLLGAGGAYLVLGDLGEALLMISFGGAIIAITWVQERRTQKALEALRDLSAPRARVVRDGRAQMIPADRVVPGDLMLLREGDRIPADADVMEGLVTVDESLLTGESVPLARMPGAQGAVQAGTLVVQGQASVAVVATGPATALGRLGKALGEIDQAPSGLQVASRRLVNRFAAGGLALAALSVWLGWAWAGRPWMESLLQGLALAMAILPEEIPVVLTVFTAMGAWRISQRKVLTRRMPAVEALGSITVLAVDKTGTLTQNRMEVAELRTGALRFRAGDPGPLEEPFHALVEFACLASPPAPFDPMERALGEFAARHLEGTEHLHGDWRSERAYELSPEILAVTRAYPEGGGFLLAAKGAPEAVADLCHLPEAALARVRSEVHAMAQAGLRVLGVARGRFEGPDWPDHQHAFDYAFLGLVGLADPVRPEVPPAMAACRAAGIRVLMLTGDHPETARAIARQVGLADAGGMLLGSDLERLDDAALGEALRTTSICARVRPEHKLRLVRALQAGGEVVAMTGDGVNDAPALQAAQVGVAMGAHGTDVAREAAALVLLDDSFASLAAAVAEGRRVYANLVKAVRFIMAVHVPVMGLSFLALALKWPPLLLPAHIVLLELIIDPACSVLLEAEPAEGDLMARPPRRVGETPFRTRNLLRGLGQGVGVWALLGTHATLARAAGWPLPVQRGSLLLALCLGAFLLVLANRRHHAPLWAGLLSNPWVPGMGAGILAAGALAGSIPGLRHLLGLSALPTPALGLALLVGAGCLLWLEAWRRMGPSP